MASTTNSQSLGMCILNYLGHRKLILKTYNSVQIYKMRLK